MKGYGRSRSVFIIAFCVALVCTEALSAEAKRFKDFDEWKKHFKKKFKDDKETKEAMGKFIANQKVIDEINAENAKKGKDLVLKMNEFGHMTGEEFGKMYLSTLNAEEQFEKFKDDASSASILRRATTNEVNETVNWVDKGCVTSVKNQGDCGSCYTFASAAVIESANCISSNFLTDLSEQQILDCSGSYGNDYCNGGLIGYSFEYIKAAGGLATNSAYPYTGKQGTCQQNDFPLYGSITQWKKISAASGSTIGETMLSFVEVAPIAVGVAASSSVFQFYSSGTITSEACNTALDHAVTIVGYDISSDISTPYWLVKNSWGTSWGDAGYVKIEYSTSLPGTCGINRTPYYAYTSESETAPQNGDGDNASSTHPFVFLSASLVTVLSYLLM
eukprot:Nk52_evm72s2367 gene=Nk52_evmTU72s2367